MQGFKLLGLFFTLLLCLGCSREGPQAPLLPDQVPSFSVTRAFGDPPVEGQVVLSPTTPSLAWNFELDLDHDGAAEHAGRLEEAVRFDYSFSKSGVHPILISFISPTAEFSDTLFVVVNGSLSVVVMARNDQALGDVLIPEMVVEGSFLYATASNRVEQFDALTLERTDVLVLEHPSLKRGLQGLGVSPSGQLYVANKRPEEVLRLSVPALQLDQAFPVPQQTGAYLVYPIADDHVVVGGGQNIVLLDATTGSIVAARMLLGSSYLAASRNSRYVAAAITGDDSSIRLLDGQTLDDLWELSIEDTDTYVVGFSPDSEVLYWLGAGLDNQLRFLAIEAASGRLLRRITLNECPQVCFFWVEASAFAQNDSYSFMMTDIGAYAIDPELHLPIARIGLPEVFICCSVTTSNDHVYFGLTDSSILRVRISRNVTGQEDS